MPSQAPPRRVLKKGGSLNRSHVRFDDSELSDPEAWEFSPDEISVKVGPPTGRSSNNGNGHKKQHAPATFDSNAEGAVNEGNTSGKTLKILIVGLSPQCRRQIVETVNAEEGQSFDTRVDGVVKVHHAPDVIFWEVSTLRAQDVDADGAALELPEEVYRQVPDTLACVLLVDERSFETAASRQRTETEFQLVSKLLSPKIFRMVLFVAGGDGEAPHWDESPSSAEAEEFAMAHQSYFHSIAIHNSAEIALVSTILRTQALNVNIDNLESVGVTFVGAEVGEVQRSPFSDTPSPRSPADNALWGTVNGVGVLDSNTDRGSDSEDFATSAPARPAQSSTTVDPTGGGNDGDGQLSAKSARRRQMMASSAARLQRHETPMSQRLRSLRPTTPPSQRHTKTSRLKFSKREDIKSPTKPVGAGGGSASGGSHALHPKAWRAPMHFEGWDNDYHYQQQKEQQKALAAAIRRKKHFSKKHWEPHTGEPALYVEVSIQRGGGLGVARSRIPVWNGVDSMELAADFVHHHRLDDMLIPTVAKLLAAEVRNWVEFEMGKQAAAQELERKRKAQLHEARHNMLASNNSIGVPVAARGKARQKRTVTQTCPFQLSTSRRPEILIQVPYEIDVGREELLTIFRGDDPLKVVAECIRNKQLPPCSARDLEDAVMRKLFSTTVSAKPDLQSIKKVQKRRQKFSSRSRDVAADRYRQSACTASPRHGATAASSFAAAQELRRSFDNSTSLAHANTAANSAISQVSPAGKALALGELGSPSPQRRSQNSDAARKPIAPPLFVLKVEVAPGLHRALEIRGDESAQDAATEFVTADGLPTTLIPKVQGLIEQSFAQYAKMSAGQNTASVHALLSSVLAQSISAAQLPDADILEPDLQAAAVVASIQDPESSDDDSDASSDSDRTKPHDRSEHSDDSEGSDQTRPHISDDDLSEDEQDMRSTSVGQVGSGSDTSPISAGNGVHKHSGVASDEGVSSGEATPRPQPVRSGSVVAKAARDIHDMHVAVKVKLHGGQEEVIQMGLLDSALDVATSFAEVAYEY